MHKCNIINFTPLYLDLVALGCCVDDSACIVQVLNCGAAGFVWKWAKLLARWPSREHPPDVSGSVCSGHILVCSAWAGAIRKRNACVIAMRCSQLSENLLEILEQFVVQIIIGQKSRFRKNDRLSCEYLKTFKGFKTITKGSIILMLPIINLEVLVGWWITSTCCLRVWKPHLCFCLGLYINTADTETHFLFFSAHWSNRLLHQKRKEMNSYCLMDLDVFGFNKYSCEKNWFVLV